MWEHPVCLLLMYQSIILYVCEKTGIKKYPRKCWAKKCVRLVVIRTFRLFSAHHSHSFQKYPCGCCHKRTNEISAWICRLAHFHLAPLRKVSTKRRIQGYRNTGYRTKWEGTKPDPDSPRNKCGRTNGTSSKKQSRRINPDYLYR